MAQTQRVSGVKTSVFTENGRTNVVYHKTIVVSFDSKTITLRSGGWETVTTKLRMNQASNQYGLGYHVFQAKGKWHVSYRDKTVDFKDGITLKRD